MYHFKIWDCAILFVGLILMALTVGSSPSVAADSGPEDVLGNYRSIVIQGKSDLWEFRADGTLVVTPFQGSEQAGEPETLTWSLDGRHLIIHYSHKPEEYQLGFKGPNMTLGPTDDIQRYGYIKPEHIITLTRLGTTGDEGPAIAAEIPEMTLQEAFLFSFMLANPQPDWENPQTFDKKRMPSRSGTGPVAYSYLCVVGLANSHIQFNRLSEFEKRRLLKFGSDLIAHDLALLDVNKTFLARGHVHLFDYDFNRGGFPAATLDLQIGGGGGHPAALPAGQKFMYQADEVMAERFVEELNRRLYLECIYRVTPRQMRSKGAFIGNHFVPYLESMRIYTDISKSQLLRELDTSFTDPVKGDLFPVLDEEQRAMYASSREQLVADIEAYTKEKGYHPRP